METQTSIYPECQNINCKVYNANNFKHKIYNSILLLPDSPNIFSNIAFDCFFKL